MTGSTVSPWSLTHCFRLRMGQETEKPLAGARGLRAGRGRRCPPVPCRTCGHCGPARLLPIIVANESTGAVWHIPPPCPAAVSGCGRSPAGGAGPRTGWRQGEGGGRRGPAPALVAARASAQLVHPAVLVLGRAALDVEQGLAQLLRDLSGLAAALLPLGTGPLDGADGGDDGGGAAGEDLGEGAVLRVALPLVDGDPLLDGLVAQVAGDAQQGVTGDALQDGPGEGGRDDPVAVDEVQVHAAQFL